jgi:methionyl-tRNA formyltransferase
MNLIFAGTPEFAAVALKALLHAGHTISLVLTQPDRPAGRGMHARESQVKVVARANDLQVAQPLGLKSADIHSLLAEKNADAMIVAAYGLILPSAVLSIPARGCLNIHASLLPRWRGAAPIQRAMLAGDDETGITVMQMDAGLDTGAMLLQETTPISAEDTAQTLHDRLAQLGGRCIVRALAEQPPAVAQNNALATYAAKITKAEAEICWALSAADICRAVRAYNPVPGAFTTLDAAPLKIWRALPLESDEPAAGVVLSATTDGIVVSAGKGAVRILELQKAGGKRLPVATFLSGTRLPAGTKFGT